MSSLIRPRKAHFGCDTIGSNVRERLLPSGKVLARNPRAPNDNLTAKICVFYSPQRGLVWGFFENVPCKERT